MPVSYLDVFSFWVIAFETLMDIYETRVLPLLQLRTHFFAKKEINKRALLDYSKN